MKDIFRFGVIMFLIILLNNVSTIPFNYKNTKTEIKIIKKSKSVKVIKSKKQLNILSYIN